MPVDSIGRNASYLKEFFANFLSLACRALLRGSLRVGRVENESNLEDAPRVL